MKSSLFEDLLLVYYYGGLPPSVRRSLMRVIPFVLDGGDLLYIKYQTLLTPCLSSFEISHHTFKVEHSILQNFT